MKVGDGVLAEVSDDVLREIIRRCELFELTTLSCVSIRLRDACNAELGATVELRRVRAHAASLLTSVSPTRHRQKRVSRWDSGAGDRGSKATARRLSRMLCEMSKMEEPLVRMLTRLDTIRCELTVLGLSAASSEAIFSVSEAVSHFHQMSLKSSACILHTVRHFSHHTASLR
jgi:hypothetical protein